MILSSDKTKLSQFRGDKSAWPIYLTIGNIAKDIRRQATSHATVLIGYLPVAKLDCFSDKARPIAQYTLFHYCVSKILASIAAAGRTGTPIACADGKVRSIWPIVAAYIADYPEQCLVACCMENRCPMCKVPPTARGNHEPHPQRNVAETLAILQEQERASSETARTTSIFKDLGLRPVYSPFWADLPHTDVFEWFTPDLLHQLHKGVFKDHLVKWCTTHLGDNEIDARFRTMSDVPGLRHFTHGISAVSQWTGAEHKEMEKVFLGLVAGAADPRIIKAVRTVIDFIYLASLHTHTTASLVALQNALDDFHLHKNVFVELGLRNQTHFNIPKIHAMEHYAAMILRFGTADGFNTESPERLHIDYAKDAYRASNRKDYLIQMVTWLHRQEAVDRFALYTQWFRHGAHQPLTSSTQDHEDADEAECVVEVTEPVFMRHPGAVNNGYHVAARPSHTLRGIPASRIMQEHNAPHFLEALTSFLRGRGCPTTFTPLLFDGFDLYSHLAVYLPVIPSTGLRHLKNVIRASPPVAARPRHQAITPRLDFALVHTGETNATTDETSLQGAHL